MTLHEEVGKKEKKRGRRSSGANEHWFRRILPVRDRIPRSLWKRAGHSFAIILGVLLIGTEGMHLLENMGYVDAFYFMSMLATAQGPAMTPATVAGKLFASLMAFVSVGTVVTSLVYVFGPFFSILLRESSKWIKEEESVHGLKSSAQVEREEEDMDREAEEARSQEK